MEQTNEQLQLRIRELEKEIAKLHTQIKKERYGLVWLDVPEGFERESENQIPVLEEVKDKAIKNDDGKPTHIIIEGDNYHALTCLNYTHKGKIDVIYIDPPYNTGSDGFTYKDKRFLKEFPDGSPVPKDHPLRHSYWLSFMSKRLELAKNLLSDKGVIFISIDDNEQANLKLLCDKVFGETCFIANVIWNSRKSVSNDAVISLNHNYTLIYTKNYNSFNNTKSQFKLIDFGNGFSNPDNDPRGFWKADPFDSPGIRPNLTYQIKNPNTGDVYWPPKGRCWRTGEKEYKAFLADNRIVFGKTGKGKPQLKRFLSEAQQRGITPKSIWDDCGTATNGTQELLDIFDEKIFETIKPTTLIERIIQLGTQKSSIILDFFAGSGTTLHATMKLNAEDGGNRQCILVQQKEGDKNICESVTYERNKRVINGYTNAKGEQISGLGNSLKYYKTAFVGKHPAKSASDDDKIQLSLRAGCLLALAENTLEEIETTSCFQIFSDGNRHFTGVYFTGKAAEIPTFAQKLEALRDENRRNKISAYFFCWGDSEQFEDEFTSLERISLKPIPKPILDIYQSINN
ncbi:MAG: site-specific DNA-methyltransferase [Bacteroidales bacterium]|nr:site-specific DNA-methyltransferase [Bacteroidales bacterium]